MADDDKKQDSAPDPWADILAGDSAEPQPELDFSFDEAADKAPPIEAPESATPIGTVPAAAAASDAALDDDLVGAWLDEPDAAKPQPAGDAIAEDVAGQSSAIELGTGASGIVADTELDVWGEASPASDSLPADAWWGSVIGATHGEPFWAREPIGLRAFAGLV